MSRPKNDEHFRLFKRKLRGEELFYCRIFDVDGTILATRSTGTSDERKAIKKALEIQKTIPKNPLKQDDILVALLEVKGDRLVMADVQTLLALNLKKYRKIIGLSQAALAEKINCSTTFIGNIEIKNRFPSPQYINRIAKALGIKPAALFAERNDPKSDDSEAVARLSDRQKRKVQLQKAVIKAISKAFIENDL